MGRKSKYESHVEPRLAEIQQMKATMSEAEICETLHVSQTAFEQYKKDHEELRDALKSGNAIMSATLKESLYKKAVGFEYEETRITMREVNGQQTKVIEKFKRYSPPDTGAIHLLLKNIDPTWRNDDQTTIDLKKEKLEIEKQKGEVW